MLPKPRVSNLLVTMRFMRHVTIRQQLLRPRLNVIADDVVSCSIGCVELRSRVFCTSQEDLFIRATFPFIQCRLEDRFSFSRWRWFLFSLWGCVVDWHVRMSEVYVKLLCETNLLHLKRQIHGVFRTTKNLRKRGSNSDRWVSRRMVSLCTSRPRLSFFDFSGSNLNLFD